MKPKTKLASLVSPKGLASYPFLNSPSTKFKPEGEYSVKLILNKEEGQKFVEQVKATLRDAYKEQCALLKKDKLKMADFPWKEEGDNFVIKFGCKASFKGKDGSVYEKRVALFDTKGNPVTELVGSNSVIRCSSNVYCWYTPLLGMGVSLQLNAVQVVELVAPSRNLSADAFGFSAEEEGYISGGESFPDEAFSNAVDEPSVTSGEEF